ncbi:MAG TPA: zinc-dependent metalloprotease, partial [Longimicrobiales bacterium]|nr:zinc-dependent metalloprotease [Longimicrobiales bacterium]
LAPDVTGEEFTMARRRQHSAHEIGHTLGFPHNYMTSAYGRESVMDYPAPLVEITDDGELDLSNAYLQRIGTYDELAVRWLYQDFPDGTDEDAALRGIVEEGIDRGLIYMGHVNNNFIGAGHRYASVWDNGANLVDHLEHEIRVRRIGLEGFGPATIREGEPLSALEPVLLPLYMHHRFQLRAGLQSLGGANYDYVLRGEGRTPYSVVPPAEQRRALAAALSTLTVEFLAIPERIVDLIPPAAFRRDEGVRFEGHTGLLFDPLGAAEAAAAYSAREILHPQRMARLVLYGSMGRGPDLEEVVDRLIEATWDAAAPSGDYRRRVLHVIQRVVADELMTQASSADNSAEVRAILSDRLASLASELEEVADPTPHQRLVASDIRRWEQRPESVMPGRPLQIPPGDPIGGSPR